MATVHEDRLPLLTNQEDVLEDDAIEIEFHGSKKRASRSADALSNSGYGATNRERNSRHGVSFSSAISSAAPSRRKKHYSGSEMMVAVFVVAFDTKKGLYMNIKSRVLDQISHQVFMHPPYNISLYFFIDDTLAISYCC